MHSSVVVWLIIGRATYDLFLRTVLPFVLCVIFACCAFMLALSSHTTPIATQAWIIVRSKLNKG